MAYDKDLADRVRTILSQHRDISEKKMFGGLTFMLRDHMCCGVMDDSLVIRIGEEGAKNALRKPHTAQFGMPGKPMKSMIVVTTSGINTDALLRSWLQLAVDFAAALPPKKQSRK